MAPALRAAFQSTAEATQMIRKIDRKNSTEILSTDQGSTWRTMRWTLRARTFSRFGAFGASGSGVVEEPSPGRDLAGRVTGWPHPTGPC